MRWLALCCVCTVCPGVLAVPPQGHDLFSSHQCPFRFFPGVRSWLRTVPSQVPPSPLTELHPGPAEALLESHGTSVHQTRKEATNSR